MKIYLAGSLFTTAEREFNVRLAGLLRQRGHEVWLPQEIEQRDKTAQEVFRKDVEGVDWADVVVANMDGADPDSGTCWECGYAFRHKPVVVFLTDFRSAEEPGKGSYNLMLTQSATAQLELPYDSTESIAARIAEVLENLAVSGSTDVVASAKV